MAIAAAQPKISDYWPRYRRRAIVTILAGQLVGVLIIGSALMTAGIVLSTTTLIITLIAVLAATISLNLIMLLFLLTPLKDMSAALTHISGEPTIITPPNPNDRHFEQDGFKPLLQMVYSLSSGSDKTGEAASSGQAIDLAVALNNLTSGLIVLDGEQHIIYANSGAPIRTGKNGLSEIDLLFEKNDTLATWLDSCKDRMIQADHTWLRVANKIPGEEGRKIYDIAASYQKGKQAEVVLTLLDRTSDYQPEDDDLDFIAFAAHELRGPITVIRGYLDVLTDELAPQLGEEQTELMTRLTVSANRLSSYINNILNASRYDRRHLKLHLKEDSLGSIYETIADDMQLRASSQHRLLSIQFSENLPTVAADTNAIGEVLGNFIDNAIKYSNEGGMVSVTTAATSNFVTVSIEDHGIGMPEQVVGNLFHKFYRSHRSRETVAGTGIGLYICKSIVESHGGTVGVKSSEGEGSTFTFSLPVYASVADKLKIAGNSNESFIEHGEGWIKNHAMFRG